MLGSLCLKKFQERQVLLLVTIGYLCNLVKKSSPCGSQWLLCRHAELYSCPPRLDSIHTQCQSFPWPKIIVYHTMAE